MVPSADLQRFNDVLKEEKSYLVLLPQNPDFDSVAAGLSLYLMLKNQGKDVTIACSSAMTVEFNRLVGVNKIRNSVGDRNLKITFADYEASGIEKVSYNIENGQFSLTVLPKAGYAAPGPEQVKIDYAGGTADVVIVVKATRSELGKFADNQELFGGNSQVVLVGASPMQGFGQAIEVIDPQASCASEVVFQIAQNLGWQLDADLAGNLLMGLRAGTNNFQNPNVTAETFAAASRLMQEGATGTTVPPNQPVAVREEQKTQAPQDWLEPKVYKGSKLP